MDVQVPPSQPLPPAVRPPPPCLDWRHPARPPPRSASASAHGSRGTTARGRPCWHCSPRAPPPSMSRPASGRSPVGRPLVQQGRKAACPCLHWWRPRCHWAVSRSLTVHRGRPAIVTVRLGDRRICSAGGRAARARRSQMRRRGTRSAHLHGSRRKLWRQPGPGGLGQSPSP